MPEHTYGLRVTLSLNRYDRDSAFSPVESLDLSYTEEAHGESIAEAAINAMAYDRALNRIKEQLR